MAILKFHVEGEEDKEALETDITLAQFAAECVYGKPRVRMEASYLVDEDGRNCVIRSAGSAGDAAARIFAGLTAVRVGETGFDVHRVDGDRNDN